MIYKMYYIGYDGIDYSIEFDDLATAQSEAVCFSELGCHSINIVDENDIEYPF